MQTLPRLMVKGGFQHIPDVVNLACSHFERGTPYELWLNPHSDMLTLATDGIPQPRGLRWRMPPDQWQMDCFKDGFVVGGGYLE